MNISYRAKQALWEKSGLLHNGKGYVEDIKLNLIPGLTSEMIEEDYCHGSGQEWREKIRAIHSSAALAANTFGRWKDNPEKLKILGHSGFHSIKLEAKCPTGLKGTPPNLDVLLESSKVVIGIESKFLEPLKETKPKFSESYLSEELKQLWEKPWKALFDLTYQGPPSHLDIAQLIKHYLGLRKQYQGGRQVILLYLYWKPTNAGDFTEYLEHDKAIQRFQTLVKNGGTVQFSALDYPTLWQAWTEDPNLADHARLLQKRYNVEL